MIVLWAWDRAEDLRFLKPGEAEVAGLLATIQLKAGAADVWHRHLPLMVPNGVPFTAVVRLESDGKELAKADSVANWMKAIVRKGAERLQIDFDARESEYAWYLDMIRESRIWFPNISITALTSWCVGEPWFSKHSEEIREAVPMLFRMGPERPAYLQALRNQRVMPKGCDTAIGISTDEPLKWRPAAKRIYLFHPKRWTREAFDKACERLR